MIKILGPALMLLSAQALGSNYTGPISLVRINTDSNSSPRVSIQVGNHGSPCPNNPPWYAYDSADTGIGKLWTAAAIAAYVNGRNVTILGTGTCDAQGIEIVSDIDLQ